MDDKQVSESLRHKTTAQKIRNFVLPSGIEALFYLAVAAAMLLVLNGDVVWNLLNSSPVTLTGDYLIKQQLGMINDRLGSVVVFGIWLGIGSVCYLIIWSLQNIAHRAQMDAQSARNIGVTDARSYWQSVFAHYFAFVSITIGFLIYTIICLQYLLPTFLNMVSDGIQHLGVMSSYFYLILASIGMSLMLYTFQLIWRVTRYIWRTIRVTE